MLKTRTVVLCGNNLVMSTVAATLRQKPHFHLGQMDVLGLAVPDAVVPDAIVFDLAAAPSDFAVHCLRDYPGILLVGVDLSDDRMLVFSGRQSRFLTVDDLTQVLEAETP